MNKQTLPVAIVSHALPDGWLELLENRCEAVIGPPECDHLTERLESHLAEADGLFTLLTIKVDEALLSRAPKLKVISNMAVGFDNIDIEACTARGIPVGNTPGVLTAGTADLTMAILLAAARRLIEAHLDACQGGWKTWSPTGWLGKDLNGATIGIIGSGKIGTAVAERASGFGMQIIFTDPNPKPELAKRLNAQQVDLEELLQLADFVSLHVPLSDQTRHLINEDTLRLMKPTALLINTSRGPIVDQTALIHALKSNLIAGAALDVTDPEPLPVENELFTLKNCLVVPHIGSATWNTRRSMASRACENLLAGLEGRPLPYCVNPEVYQS
ncbi:MAG: 2-hydroxyacid dehydrogenase [Anaerolineales bacterium]|jgi:lactate dehydrogenase-like 2-hydroxyacid dehydrogenase